MASPPPAWTARPALPLWQGLLFCLAFAFTLVSTGTLGCVIDQPNGWSCLGFSAHEWLRDALAAVVMWLLTVLAFRQWPPRPDGRRPWPALLGLTLAAGLVGAAALCGLHLLLLPSPLSLADALAYLPYIVQLQLILAATMVFGLAQMQRSQAARAALHRSTLAAIDQERELSNARLQLLQAQVEPHFLFNTLATLRRLLRTDAAGARAMLRDLQTYLGQALPSLRQANSTLGREIELVRAYLALHQMRMGGRLKLRFDIQPGLDDCVLPPMMLLTLVENALKHGLAPLVEGGTVQIEARAEGGSLSVSVSDDGRGMGNASGHGTGLANIRARLKAIHGGEASLSLTTNLPRGLRAQITLPERRA